MSGPWWAVGRPPGRGHGAGSRDAGFSCCSGFRHSTCGACETKCLPPRAVVARPCMELELPPRVGIDDASPEVLGWHIGFIDPHLPDTRHGAKQRVRRGPPYPASANAADHKELRDIKDVGITGNSRASRYQCEACKAAPGSNEIGRTSRLLPVERQCRIFKSSLLGGCHAQNLTEVVNIQMQQIFEDAAIGLQCSNKGYCHDFPEWRLTIELCVGRLAEADHGQFIDGGQRSAAQDHRLTERMSCCSKEATFNRVSSAFR